MFKINSTGVNLISLVDLLVSLMLTLSIFSTLISVVFVNFEQVFAGWEKSNTDLLKIFRLMHLLYLWIIYIVYPRWVHILSQIYAKSFPLGHSLLQIYRFKDLDWTFEELLWMFLKSYEKITHNMTKLLNL